MAREPHDWLAQAVDDSAARSVLVLGAGLAPELRQRRPGLEVTEAAELGALQAPAQRFDLATVDDGWLAGHDQEAATHTLAALRDLHAAAVAVRSQRQTTLSHADLLALGFSVREEPAAAAGQAPAGAAAGSDAVARLYGFNLYDYKRRPDWLNPRYWANPEMWERYRW